MPEFCSGPGLWLSEFRPWPSPLPSLNGFSSWSLESPNLDSTQDLNAKARSIAKAQSLATSKLRAVQLMGSRPNSGGPTNGVTSKLSVDACLTSKLVEALHRTSKLVPVTSKLVPVTSKLQGGGV